MDWKTIVTTFATIFLAELGDKTQLATFTFAGSSRSQWSVFIGSALALVTSSAIAVLAGDALARTISPHVLKRAAGVAFLVIGVWMLWSSKA